MIHILKKGNITLSNWIQDSKMNWMKHRVLDYNPPIDTIHILRGRYDNGSDLVWAVNFTGKNIEYIEYLFFKIYGYDSYPESKLEELKNNIDNLLLKADKLIIFA